MDNETKDVNCPLCRENIKLISPDLTATNLITCPYCKEYFVMKPDSTFYKTILIGSEVVKEIQPIAYEKLLTAFDYELATVARVIL